MLVAKKVKNQLLRDMGKIKSGDMGISLQSGGGSGSGGGDGGGSGKGEIGREGGGEKGGGGKVTVNSMSKQGSSIERDRRVCSAIAAGLYQNTARRSANSDKIFYSIPLIQEKSMGQGQIEGQGQGEKQGEKQGERHNNSSNSSQPSNTYHYDTEKLFLHVHPSSVLTYVTASECLSSGCWKRLPEHVIYQVRRELIILLSLNFIIL